MNLEDLTKQNMPVTKKMNAAGLCLYEIPGDVRLVEMERTVVRARCSGRRREGSQCLMGTAFQLRRWREFWRWQWLYNTENAFNATEIVHLGCLEWPLAWVMILGSWDWVLYWFPVGSLLLPLPVFLPLSVCLSWIKSLKKIKCILLITDFYFWFHFDLLKYCIKIVLIGDP